MKRSDAAAVVVEVVGVVCWGTGSELPFLVAPSALSEITLDGGVVLEIFLRGMLNSLVRGDVSLPPDPLLPQELGLTLLAFEVTAVVLISGGDTL